jgi:hypothetical protein
MTAEAFLPFPVLLFSNVERPFRQMCDLLFQGISREVLIPKILIGLKLVVFKELSPFGI